MCLMSVFKKTNLMQTSQFTSRAHFPPSLRALLTTPMIIKIGCGLRRALSTLATVYDDAELRKASTARGNTLLELGLHDKLKGAITTPTQTLHALVGIILERSFTPISYGNLTDLSGCSAKLHDEVEAIWQTYLKLAPRNSVG